MPAGQAQKEFFVNEAFARTDALLHCAIEGTASDPPAAPQDGQAWLVGSAPTGGWAGHEGEIACRQFGNWLFAAPRDGMAVLDRASGQIRRYAAGWKAPVAPEEPVGGTTIDSQARAAIAQLIGKMREAGLFAAS